MDGRAYLKTYYAGQEEHPDNVCLLSFLAQATKHLEDGAQVLDLASGPTLYQAASAARMASTIILSDISPSLLAISEQWRDAKADAFDWDPYIKKALELESSHGIPSGDDLDERREKIRKAIDFAIVNILKSGRVKVEAIFDLVQCGFLGTSVATSHEDLVEIWKRSADFVKPGGDLIFFELSYANGCHAEGEHLYTYDVGYEEQAKLIESIGCEVITKQQHTAVEGTGWGYSGVTMFHLRKPIA